MPSITHQIQIRHRDDNPANPLVFTHTDSGGGDLGDLNANEPFFVKNKDKVRWKCALGNFSILFKGQAPFNGNVVVEGGAAGDTTSARVVKTFGGTGAAPVKIRFEYAVTVIEGPPEPPVATTVDPLMELTDSG